MSPQLLREAHPTARKAPSATSTEQTERTNAMTDHLINARACVTSASQAPDAGSAIAWLTDTCKQIIAHLEAQQTSQQATSADLTASQPEPEQLDGSDFMDWMADRLADPEVRAGYLAAHAREVREQVARELHYEDKAMTRFSAPSHARRRRDRPYREGIRDGLAAAARIARKEQP